MAAVSAFKWKQELTMQSLTYLSWAEESVAAQMGICQTRGLRCLGCIHLRNPDADNEHPCAPHSPLPPSPHDAPRDTTVATHRLSSRPLMMSCGTSEGAWRLALMTAARTYRLYCMCSRQRMSRGSREIKCLNKVR